MEFSQFSSEEFKATSAYYIFVEYLNFGYNGCRWLFLLV